MPEPSIITSRTAALFLANLLVQPFPVICETCRARLKIRDASVIGEIHACPRCGGMVHIIPPAGWTDESATVGGIAAATSVAIPTPTPIVTTPTVPPPTTSVVTPPAIPLAPASQFADFAIDESLIQPPSAAPASVVQVNVASAPTVASDMPATPAAAHAPSFIQRALAQPILLWGGVAAVLLFASGFTAAVLLMSNDDGEVALATGINNATPQAEPPKTQSSATHPETTETTAVQAADDTEHPETSDAVAEADTTESDQANPYEVSRPVVSDLTSPEPTAPLTTEPQLPELPPDEPASANTTGKVAAAPGTQVQSDNETNTSTPAADVPASAPVLKFDPLNFDPLELGFSAGNSSGEPVAAASVADEPVATGPLPPPTDVDESTVDNPNHGNAPEHEETITVQRGASDATAATGDSDINRQLALPIESIQLRELPLARFVESMAQLAGTPITLDPAALAMAGTSPRDLVEVRARNTTLEKLLRDTLKKHRLEFIEHEGQLVVVRPKTDERRSVNYELKDLVGLPASASGTADAPTKGDASGLSALLQRYVAPDTWQAAGGAGKIDIDGTKLRVQQSHAVHYQALIFFERLRLARGLTPRSNYPAKLLSVESPYARLAAPLDESTTFTFLPWTPLADVVRHWEEATGLTILVDWQALVDLELAPLSPVSCSAIDRTWDEVLSTILTQLGLAWRAVDGQAIQITSAAAADQLRSIEFYAVPQSLLDQFASPGALTESLAAELEKEMTAAGNTSPPAIQLEIDAPSGRLIALAGAAAHRYLTKRLGDSLGATEVRATPISAED